MATVTVSIGQGVSHDENAVISAVSGAGPSYTVTIAANSSVDGDAIFDEHATPRKYLITAGGGTTSLTVRDTEGTGAAPDNSGTSLSKIERYYNGSTPITDWEADLDSGGTSTDLYDASDDAVGEAYNDGVFDETPTINGGGTIGLTSITLTVPSAERHDGTAGVGARIVITSTPGGLITLGDTTILHTIEWLELDSGGAGARIGLNLNAGGFGAVLAQGRNLIIHGGSRNSSGIIAGIATQGGARQRAALNCIVYDIHNTGNTVTAGISIDSTQASFLDNCTVHDVSSDATTANVFCVEMVDDVDVDYQNIIATDPSGPSTSGTVACYSLDPASNATVDHNLASDTSASGTGSLDNKTAVDQFVSTTGGSEDLHLSSDADANDAGTDLGATPAGVEIDIDGRDRDAQGDTWDMGADEFVEAAGGLIAGSLALMGVGK